MTKLRITIDDERLSGRLRQRAENMGGVAVNGLVQALLMRALDQEALDQDDGFAEKPEPPPAPRKLDETTQRCVDNMRDVCGRLEEASPTVGLIKFSDDSEASDGAVVRTLSLCVMMLPPRT